MRSKLGIEMPPTGSVARSARKAWTSHWDISFLSKADR
jgi:hypothetical protein